MPMIDVYATAGTFTDKHQLAADLAATLMAIEKVPDIPMFRQNTAGFVHELPAGDLSNVDGASNYVRVQVLTNAGALDRDKQIAVVSQFTSIVADAAHDPALAERTWVLLTEAVPGGWGLSGHANTNDELVAAARKQMGRHRPAGVVQPGGQRARRGKQVDVDEQEVRAGRTAPGGQPGDAGREGAEAVKRPALAHQ